MDNERSLAKEITEGFEALKSMRNNEPVAWGWYDLEIKRFFPHWDEDFMENKEGCIPLYTHPIKELTDEEKQMILNIWEKLQPHLFVKAQEK
jgi:hypothetical protein